MGRANVAEPTPPRRCVSGAEGPQEPCVREPTSAAGWHPHPPGITMKRFGLSWVICGLFAVTSTATSDVALAQESSGTEGRGAQTTLAGQFAARWGDAPDGRSVLGYVLTDDNGDEHALEIGDALLAEAGGLHAIDRQRVIVQVEPTAMQAMWVDGPPPARKVLGLFVTRPEGVLGTQADAAAERLVAGARPWVSVLWQVLGHPHRTGAAGFIRRHVPEVDPGLDHYWRASSYDTANVAGSSAAGWFTLPLPRSSYVSSSADLNKLAVDCIAAADPFVDFSTNAGVNMVFNQTLDCCA